MLPADGMMAAHVWSSASPMAALSKSSCSDSCRRRRTCDSAARCQHKEAANGYPDFPKRSLGDAIFGLSRASARLKPGPYSQPDWMDLID
jgi:hypothetical protein